MKAWAVVGEYTGPTPAGLVPEKMAGSYRRGVASSPTGTGIPAAADFEPGDWVTWNPGLGQVAGAGPSVVLVCFEIPNPDVPT